MDSSHPQISAQTLFAVPFKERWDIIKPLVVQLYVNEKKSLSAVQKAIREQTGFDANESQYRYSIKKWGLQKNIPKSKKEAIVKLSMKETSSGAQPAFKYKGQAIDPEKLRRHIKDSSRLQRIPRKQMRFGGICSPLTSAASKIILGWNMPYGAMKNIQSMNLDHFSPFTTVSTPSDVEAATPIYNEALSPPRTQSLLSCAVVRTTALQRAHLFLDGRYDELRREMDKAQRRAMTNLLYQFWLFSFKTTKFWGRGPRRWNARLLGFDKHHEPRSESNITSPAENIWETDDTNYGSSPSQSFSPRNQISKPSDLCRWSIHTWETNEGYDPVTPESGSEDDIYEDFNNEQSFSEWPRSWYKPDVSVVLRDSLENNDFSNVELGAVSTNVSEVLKNAPRTADDMLRESFAFSIMSRNIDLLKNLIDRINDTKAIISDLYPFHLATTFLDASKTCCNLLDLLIQSLEKENSFRSLKVNDLGHTVTDNLMITIIRSHTTCPPGLVERSWAKSMRFQGADVDICGRWDADSECVRSLLAADESIFHRKSGLFSRRCLSCGLKLELFPLHTLVLTGFTLAQYGLEMEDLSGILACVLCLLWQGAWPFNSVDISIPALLGQNQSAECDHKNLDPAQLGEELYDQSARGWSISVRLGWKVMCHILRRAREQWHRPGLTDQESVRTEAPDPNSFPGADMNISMGHERQPQNNSDPCSSSPFLAPDDDPICRGFSKGWGYHNNFFTNDKMLGTIWAAINTEMLTYRRQTMKDTWNSTNFDIQSIHDCLEKHDEKLNIGLIEEGLMNDHCFCGGFLSPSFGNVTNVPTMEDVSSKYFANLEDWSRITVIPQPHRYRF